MQNNVTEPINQLAGTIWLKNNNNYRNWKDRTIEAGKLTNNRTNVNIIQSFKQKKIPCYENKADKKWADKQTEFNFIHNKKGGWEIRR